jgi:hypothetical protein
MSIAYQRWTPGRKFSADPPETENLPRHSHRTWIHGGVRNPV